MKTCPSCSKENPDDAQFCSSCGKTFAAAPAIPTKKKGKSKPVLIGCLGIVGIFIVFAIISPYTCNTSRTPTDTSSTTPTQSQPAAVAPKPSPAPQPGSQWSYNRSEDPMATGTSYTAAVQSTNTVEFEFPYSGAQHATLILRTHPRYGKDVILRIERGQFLCSSYDGCTALVRFDDQKAQDYSAGAASDNSTETIFVRNYQSFVSNMQKAKIVRISAKIFQQGAPVFEFDVSGFDPTKYTPK